MNATPRQLGRLHAVADLAHALALEQRSRAERYQTHIENQRRWRHRLSQIEPELARLSALPERAAPASARSRDGQQAIEEHARALDRVQAEVASLRTQISQSESAARELQLEIENARPFVGAYNERIDSVMKHLRTTRAALGINFESREAGPRRADVTR